MKPPMIWTQPLADGRLAVVTLEADSITVDISDGQRLALPVVDVGAVCLGLQECAALAGRLRVERAHADPSSGTAEMRSVTSQLRSDGKP